MSTRKKYLTRREAWLVIQKAYSNSIKEFSVDSLAVSGLCNATEVLFYRGTINREIFESMQKDIQLVRPPKAKPDWYYWELGTSGARKRVEAICKILQCI